MSGTVETFEGHFLTPSLTWLVGDTEPGPGYCIGTEAELFRNGEFVGTVLSFTYGAFTAPGFRVDYRSWRGSPMDSLAVQEAS